jgi:signal peptidase I
MIEKKKTTWRDYLEILFLAIFLALFVRTFVISGYKVPTSSMAPTLLPGDFIFAFKMPFGFQIPVFNYKTQGKMPERGQVVVFTYPDQPQVTYVKRVLGLPGDLIEIKNGRVFLNGVALNYKETEESAGLDSNASLVVYQESGEGLSHKVTFQKSEQDRQFGPFVVPPAQVFLLGDFRDLSDDSRYWGAVPAERVEGQIVLIWLSLKWPAASLGRAWPTVRWERVFSTVPSKLD